MSGLSLRTRLFARSFLLQAGFSDERRQGLGFAWALEPALALAYAGDAAGLNAALARHLAAFNAQPSAASLPLGVSAALEARAARGDAAAAARAVGLKDPLCSALSGAADSFFWGALRPLAAASAVAGAIVAAHFGARRPLACGAALGLLIFNIPSLWVRWAGLGRGLRDGDAVVPAVCGLPVQKWISAARRAAVLAILAAAGAALALRLGLPPLAAAFAFAAGAGLGRVPGGPLRLVAAAGLLGAVASAAGWTGWAR